MSYSSFTPRVPALRGSPLKADVIAALSFGRNTFPDKGLAASLENCFQQHQVYRDALDTARFAALRKGGFNPGNANKAIAYRLRLSSQKEGIRVLVGQWEVMYSLWENDPHWYDESSERHFVVWPQEEDGYLSTKLVLQKIFAICQENERILLLAHRHHMLRAVLTADKIFGQDRVIVTPAGAAVYDPDSVQVHTRHQKNFARYEQRQRLLEAFPERFQELVRKLRG